MRYFNHAKLAFNMYKNARGAYQPNGATRVAQHAGPGPWKESKLVDDIGRVNVYVCHNEELVPYFTNVNMFIAPLITDAYNTHTHDRTPPQVAELVTQAMADYQ